jgi:hypothetical protein
MDSASDANCKALEARVGGLHLVMTFDFGMALGVALGDMVPDLDQAACMKRVLYRCWQFSLTHFIHPHRAYFEKNIYK